MRTIFANAISATASLGFTALAVMASAPASAATIDPTPRAVIQTADLDLASTDGYRSALRRIEGAADRVCDVTPGDRLGSAACRARAVREASRTLDRLRAPEQVAAR